MKLPHAQRAEIAPEKLHGYLLSFTHPIGRSKAAFFLSLGYEAKTWQRLEADLREQILNREARRLEDTAYGVKYEVRGTLTGPARRAAEIVTVWIVLHAHESPRFVTAYPG